MRGRTGRKLDRMLMYCTPGLGDKRKVVRERRAGRQEEKKRTLKQRSFLNRDSGLYDPRIVC